MTSSQQLIIPVGATVRQGSCFLEFDLYELLIMAGHLLPDPSTFSEEQRDKLQTELNTLLERVASDSNSIKEIINKLLLSK